MELSERKKAILTEIVKFHIETGEPIGSKILATRLKDSPSTATLRNEMNELDSLGYLTQPHTSAGRIPTEKAYKLFVSTLMRKEGLTDETKSVIDLMLDGITPDLENMGSSAAEILSRLTGLTAISAPSSEFTASLKKVNLMSMGRGTAVIFVITSLGRTGSRLVKWDSSLTESLINRFNLVVEEKVIGKDVSLLDMAYLQNVVAATGLDALELAPLLSTVFDMAKEVGKSKVNLKNEANLFPLWNNDNDTRKAVELLSTADAVNNIFSLVKTPVSVIFGDETPYSELKDAGMIVASLGLDEHLGKIALIGPTRMEYESLMPSVEYIAGKVGKIMSELIRGLEE